MPKSTFSWIKGPEFISYRTLGRFLPLHHLVTHLVISSAETQPVLGWHIRDRFLSPRPHVAEHPVQYDQAKKQNVYDTKQTILFLYSLIHAE